MLDFVFGESFSFTMSQTSAFIFPLVHNSLEKTLQAGMLLYLHDCCLYYNIINMISISVLFQGVCLPVKKIRIC